MQQELISERHDLLIRRLVLAPGEATPWHTDSCHRFSVVVRGERLRIEFADGSEVVVDVAPGLTGWDAPEPRPHRAINVGTVTYEEVVTFHRPHGRVEPQPPAPSPPG